MTSFLLARFLALFGDADFDVGREGRSDSYCRAWWLLGGQGFDEFLSRLFLEVSEDDSFSTGDDFDLLHVIFLCQQLKGCRDHVEDTGEQIFGSHDSGTNEGE